MTARRAPFHPLLTALFAAGAIPALSQPVNDNCASVTPVVVLSGTQHLFTGDNTGGTATGDAVPGSSTDDGFPRVWHAFVLQDCGDVIIDYCGNAPAMGAVSSALMTSCPADDPVILADAQSSAQCGDGNLTLTYFGLPAGTYYLPIFSVFTPLGPYQVQVSVGACTGAPANDECAGAYLLAVQSAGECPANAVLGNNVSCSQSAPAPACLGPLPYQDAWFRFDAGADTLLLLNAEAITASEIGIEILDACGGGIVHCTVGTNIVDTIAVTAFASYRIRVFTQVDSGTPGSFGLCLSQVPAPIFCDGGTVALSTGDTVLSICTNTDPDPIALAHTSTSAENYAYFLCSALDTVLQALNGDSLGVDTLPLGSYHIHGFSFNGTVTTPFVGLSIDSVTASGSCGEVSSNFVMLDVEICSAIPMTASSRGELLIVPNPAVNEVDIRHWTGEPLLFVFLDATGREVWKTTTSGASGITHLSLPSHLASGQYTIRCTGRAATAHARMILR